MFKIKEYFDQVAPKREYWKKKNGYYYEYVEDKLLPFLIPPGKKVLEIGCGTGDLLNKLKPVRGLGIDISEKMITLASKKYSGDLNLEFSLSKIEDLSEKFDFVVMSDLIGYLDDIQDVLSKLHRLISPRSRIVITQYSQTWEPILEMGSKLKSRMPSKIQNWVSEQDIENVLYLSGFEVITKGKKMIMP